jgi:hypothetical protein
LLLPGHHYVAPFAAHSLQQAVASRLIDISNLLSEFFFFKGGHQVFNMNYDVCHFRHRRPT